LVGDIDGFRLGLIDGVNVDGRVVVGETVGFVGDLDSWVGVIDRRVGGIVG